MASSPGASAGLALKLQRYDAFFHRFMSDFHGTVMISLLSGETSPATRVFHIPEGLTEGMVSQSFALFELPNQ